MKKAISKLSLKKETIATLNNNAMGQVLGGNLPTRTSRAARAEETLVPQTPTRMAPNTLETTVVGYLTIHTVA